jgi:hypothetical protein
MARRAYGPHTAKSMACRVREWRWTPRESAILGRRDNAPRVNARAPSAPIPRREDDRRGIDLNKPRLRHVAEAIIALSASPDGFTGSALADQVRALGNQSLSAYGPRQAAYDLTDSVLWRDPCLTIFLTAAETRCASLRNSFEVTNKLLLPGDPDPVHAAKLTVRSAICRLRMSSNRTARLEPKG